MASNGHSCEVTIVNDNLVPIGRCGRTAFRMWHGIWMCKTCRNMRKNKES